uniref:Uncharacterized protein n=1 Tax=Anguilla anguilla TaxID=7936 RepID=A0A0E9QT63_ANGAN
MLLCAVYLCPGRWFACLFTVKKSHEEALPYLILCVENLGVVFYWILLLFCVVVGGFSKNGVYSNP